MEHIPFLIEKSPRIDRLVSHLYENLPVVEPYRAEIVTSSYRATESYPLILRRSAAFRAIMEQMPVVIRPDELIVGSNSVAPRGAQTYPEYSYAWLEPEFDTLATREADPFYISEDTKARLKAVHPYWEGKTVSDLAEKNMSPMAREVFFHHGIFTVGNYFYNGIGHVCVDYGKVLAIGYEGIRREAMEADMALSEGDADYIVRHQFLLAVCESCEAVIAYAKRYAAEARKQAGQASDPERRAELLIIAENCERVPAHGARTFYEACQSFWFVQSVLQLESSGHSISPGRFDVYMYPYYRHDVDAGILSKEKAQELIDCIWVKLNDLNKVRDAASAEGFAGYGLFQNLIVGGQDKEGRDITNDLSFMCLEASRHVHLPQPSLSIRVWNGSPDDLLLKAASVVREGLGVPAYYNDEVMIPALMSRGIPLAEAREYCIIGCVEPQVPHRTDGWHDAAFFNMCRPLELVFSNGVDEGIQIGPKTGLLSDLTTFEAFFNAYRAQENRMIELMVNADNAIDLAHARRCPLPFESCMVDNCIASGKSVQEGGAVYNFTGPQGFGIANVTDALYAIRELVYRTHKYTLEDFAAAMRHNFGQGYIEKEAYRLTLKVVENLAKNGVVPDAATIRGVYENLRTTGANTAEETARYTAMRADIDALPKYGNDLDEVDRLAREVAYTYTKPLETYRNVRGGIFQAGLYPVSANVPLGAQTGATPDGRLAGTPLADGIGPAGGRDVAGPTAVFNSVAKLDHAIASNGTLLNMKFHPSALSGMQGLTKFTAMIRGYFDQKAMHVQFNVVSRETLLDAQKYPEKYKTLVVRVAGYSALFTTLSRALQDDIISRTEQSV